MSIESRIKTIENRNKRVEEDKAWETSWTRRLTIAGLTYIVVLMYLFLIENENPWINAVVPSVGFLLSTLVIGKVKKIWQAKK